MELLRSREMELGVRVDINRVSPDYFRTLGIRLAGGRDFSSRDAVGAAGVAIVNQSLAERMWPGQNAIGQLLRRIADQQGLAPGVHPGYGRLGGPGKGVCDTPGKPVR